MLNKDDAYVMTSPLILDSNGKKFGKSEGGAIWLDSAKTSPYKFYQFWLNIDDEMAESLIKIYTLLERETIESLILDHKENPSERTLQKTLAREVTELVHGRERCESVERVTAVLFGSLNFNELSDSDTDELAREIATTSIGNTIVDTLVGVGVAKSNGEARRLMESGAVSENGQKIVEDRLLTEKTLLKKGKNSFVLVR